MEKDPELFQGHFNLGDAYYKQGRYDEALQSYKNSLQFTDDKTNEAKAYHNIGNALMKQQSVGAYANSLKKNPDDLDTKYNLSYALNMLKQNQQQQKNKNDKDQDKNKDQQQNQDQQNNQDKKDQNKDKQQNQQQQKNQISKEDAQRILEALKNTETDLQKKLRKVKGKPVVTEKDW